MNRFLLTLLLCLLIPSASQAESADAMPIDESEVINRLDRIEEKLSTIERYLYSQTVGNSGENSKLLKSITSQLKNLELLVIEVKTVSPAEKTTKPTEEKEKTPASMDKSAPHIFKKNEPKIEVTQKEATKESDTPPKATAQPIPKTPEQESAIRNDYEAAFNLVKSKEYDHAIIAFIEFIEAHKTDALAENAYYWLAESYYAKSNYQQAAVEFLKGYQTYPAGSKGADSLLKLALSLAKINKQSEACGTLDKLTEEFPDAPPAIKERRNEEYTKLDCS